MRRKLALATILPVGLVGLVGLVGACSKDPRIEERPIVVYSPRSCPVSQDAAFAVMYGAGDFEPADDRPAARTLFLRETGSVLEELPQYTRSLVVDVSQPGRDVDWRGIRETIPEAGAINVLVWPGGESCRLSRNVQRRSDASLAVFGENLLVAGGQSLDNTQQVPQSFVGDLSTGVVEGLQYGLNVRRSRPTITTFTLPDDDTPAALVAGGSDPETGTALSTAEFYLANPDAPGQVGDFTSTRINLSEPRALHGAVVLASGETLLVGGVGPRGPLRSMEIVDPKTNRARIDGVALLAVPRKRPTVLRLATGEILVAGGVDQNDQPVPTLEWFAPDASRPSKRPIDLVTGRDRAFVPLAAGGALAVIIPENATPDFKTVWVISAEGTLEPGIPLDPASLSAVRLFAGPDSSPALWTGERWYRWQPWFAAFEPIGDAPQNGPKSDAIASGDNGLALWLDDQAEAGMYVMGYRFATRSKYGTVPKPLLVGGPDQLAPDRIAGAPGSSIRFDQNLGLLMGQGASAFLTDVTFTDFTVDVDVTAAAPSIVLREESGRELEVGGAGCGFTQTAQHHISVRRSGPTVVVRADDGEERVCPTQIENGSRVGIGLRGGAGTGLSGGRNLVVFRL
jgi:hypothetical protein